MYEIVDAKRGMRHPLTEREHGVVTLLRSGVPVEEAGRRAGAEGVNALCDRLLAAGFFVADASGPRRSFLPDDRPRLVEGLKFYRSDKPGLVTCREPRAGRNYTLRDVDAMIANGLRLVRCFLVVGAQPESAPFTNAFDSAFSDAGLSGVACEKERKF